MLLCCAVMPKYLVLFPPSNVVLPCLRLPIQRKETHRSTSSFTAELSQLYSQDVTWPPAIELFTMWSVWCLVRPTVTSIAFRFYVVYKFRLSSIKDIIHRSKEIVCRWIQRHSYFFNTFYFKSDPGKLQPTILSKPRIKYDFSQDGCDDEYLDKPWTIEVSWEICNQVGGIYTVIKTKAYKVVEMLGNRYVTIGPYINDINAMKEIDMTELPPKSPFSYAVEVMRRKGFEVFTGRWNTPGNPLTILFDINAARSKVIDRYRYELERDLGIEIPRNDIESNDAIVFGYLVSEFVAQFHEVIHHKSAILSKEEPIIVHFHEWLGTIGLFFLLKWKVHVATVFTTHATLLGRYICAGGKDLYTNLRLINPDREASIRGILHRHLIERAAAQHAHVFTTVSEITGLEAEYLLGWKPDVLTLNGLSLPPSTLQFDQLHLLNKRKIDDFVRKHFHENIDFETDNVLYFFSAGRYEFRNKGIDLFIESLCRLNYLLKISRTNIRVVAFLIYPAKTKDLNEHTLKRHADVEQLRKTIYRLEKETGRRVFDTATNYRIPSIEDATWRKVDAIRLENAIFYSRPNLPPPITTHNVINDDNDPILCELRRYQLFNYRFDHVKVVFYPQFLNKSSPLIPLDYQEFIQGCDLGVFPSYYEPWGYTPAECVNNGTPAITTNLSGYGQYILGRNIEDPKSHGIYVVDRRHSTAKESVQELTDFLLEFALMSQSQRDAQRRLATSLGRLLDWDHIYENYRLAHCMAVLRSI